MPGGGGSVDVEELTASVTELGARIRQAKQGLKDQGLTTDQVNFSLTFLSLGLIQHLDDALSLLGR